jgi:AcrR family transcriptional regulator
MARIFKEDEYNAKRDEILDFALSLVYSKGYEQMTTQDILDGLHISRGAFYHYFDSKQTLLEALVDRMAKTAEQSILPIVQDPHLSAPQKFQRYFEASARWKTMQKGLILNLLSMWYSDENFVIRQKLVAGTLTHTARYLESIIRQGIEEKVFTTRFPEQAAVIIAGAALNLTDSLIGLFLAPAPDQAAYQKVAIVLDAYVDSVERILGAPTGSLQVLEADAFKDWFVAVPPMPAAESPAPQASPQNSE